MGRFGMGELLVVLVILLLVFGATRLPQIGEGLGKAIRNLKRGLSTDDDDLDVTPKENEQLAATTPSAKRVGKDAVDAEVVDT